MMIVSIEEKSNMDNLMVKAQKSGRMAQSKLVVGSMGNSTARALSLTEKSSSQRREAGSLMSFTATAQ